MSLTLLVLAAGLGSRYGGLKQLEPVGPAGETILDYSVYDACRAGFTRVVFAIRQEFANAFRENVVTRLARHVDVELVFQEKNLLPGGLCIPEARTKPWGTGHAVWCSRTAIRGPFAVINADDFYGADAYRLLATELNRLDRPRETGAPAPFALVAYRLGRTLSDHGAVSRGLIETQAGHLNHIEETHGLAQNEGDQGIRSEGNPVALSADALVSMNLWGLTPAVFPLLEQAFVKFLSEPGAKTREFYLPTAISQMVQAKEAAVRVFPTEESWFGITYREDRPTVTAAVQAKIYEGVYPSPLWR